MIRATPVVCVLLLATSCLPKSSAWRLEPVSATGAVPDPRAHALAVIERVVQQHGFVASGATPECTREWRRSVTRPTGEAPRTAEASVCAQYGTTSVITVRLVERVMANRAWSPAADSLRQALTDSLVPLGARGPRDR
jgi:hypothetical protein